MKVALIPCVDTEWLEEGRILGRVELSPAPEAEGACESWAAALAGTELRQIVHGPDELATRTARVLGRKLVVPTKVSEALSEVDTGLWTGLTEGDLKSRYGSAHRELKEAPLNVSPPGGENIGDAAKRLKTFLKKLVKSNGAAIGLVLRPMTLGLVRCLLEGRDPSELWEIAKQTRAPLVIDGLTKEALKQ